MISTDNTTVIMSATDSTKVINIIEDSFTADSYTATATKSFMPELNPPRNRKERRAYARGEKDWDKDREKYSNFF